jgi:hypothetical protein
MAPIADFKQRVVMSGPRSPSVSKPANCPNLSTNTNGHADKFHFDSMEDALDAFARGEFLVVMDDESRENEGDLIIAASHCTTEKMAWMIKHTRFVSLSPTRDALSLSAENLKWLHLHLTSKRAVGGARNTNDGFPERGSSPNRLYHHS